LHPFDYEKPTSLEEAGALLAQAEGNGCVLAGGTNVLLRLEAESIDTAILVDIKGIPELREISFNSDSGLSLGASTTLSALATHGDVRRHYPLVAAVSNRVGSARIRNRATIGGNVCAALPSSDLPTILLCCDAVCHLWSPRGERAVPLAEFYKERLQTVLEPGELLIRITMPTPRVQTHGVYHNLRQGQGGSVNLVGAAVFATKVEKQLTDWRIALAGVATKHIRVFEAEQYLDAEAFGSINARVAADLASQAAQPSDDIRASAYYRQAMVSVLVRRGIEDVAGQFIGRGK